MANLIADKDKAREIIGNVNNYAEDDGELSTSAFGPLSGRIAAALGERERKTWEVAIGAVAILPRTKGTVNFARGYEEGVRDALRTLEEIAALEAAKNGDNEVRV